MLGLRRLISIHRLGECVDTFSLFMYHSICMSDQCCSLIALSTDSELMSLPYFLWSIHLDNGGVLIHASRFL